MAPSQIIGGEGHGQLLPDKLLGSQGGSEGEVAGQVGSQSPCSTTASATASLADSSQSPLSTAEPNSLIGSAEVSVTNIVGAPVTKLTIDWSTTIREVKTQLQAVTKMPCDEQCLIFENSVLEDLSTLYDLDSCSPVHLQLVCVRKRLAVSGSRDYSLRIWNVQNGSCLGELHGHTRMVLCVAAGWDMSWCISGSYDEAMRVWDLKSKECFQEVVSAHTHGVHCVSANWDLQLALTGGGDNVLKLWDLTALKRSRLRASDPDPPMDTPGAAPGPLRARRKKHRSGVHKRVPRP